VNTPLLNSAAKYRSVNPEQVKSLLATQVKLNDEGEVDVLGKDGSIVYKDDGTKMNVDDLVKTFLTDNPHFVSPAPSTTNTKSSHTVNSSKVEFSKLDMSNPEHRKLYAEAKEKGTLTY